jgi:DNA replication protein
MSFEDRPTPDLLRVAAAGGGFRLDASLRPTSDLVRIATAAFEAGARVTFAGLNARPTSELLQIAMAGKGFVVLEG